MMSCCYSYRLAPEAVFPDQYHDALAASRAFLSPEVLERYGIDPERTCVSGDSAGGNLAAAVAQEVNKTRTRPYFQIRFLSAAVPAVSFRNFLTLHRHNTDVGGFSTAGLTSI